CGLRNQVQANEKNRQTYHNKKNEGSDAVVPIEWPGDEVSKRRRGEQKQNEYAKNRKRHRFGPAVSVAVFLCQTAKTNNIANSQRIRGNSIPLQSYAATIFHLRHLRDPDVAARCAG
ncbi:MAG: hypothetical protein WAM76_08665, partial [Pseudolabrys sp.]